MFSDGGASLTPAILSYAKVTNLAERSHGHRPRHRPWPFHGPRHRPLLRRGSQARLHPWRQLAGRGRGDRTRCDRRRLCAGHPIRIASGGGVGLAACDEITDIAKKLAAEAGSGRGHHRAQRRQQRHACRQRAAATGAFANADNAETMRVRMSRELDWAEADLRINTSGGIHRTASRALSEPGRGGKIAERMDQSPGLRVQADLCDALNAAAWQCLRNRVNRPSAEGHLLSRHPKTKPSSQNFLVKIIASFRPAVDRPAQQLPPSALVPKSWLLTESGSGQTLATWRGTNARVEPAFADQADDRLPDVCAALKTIALDQGITVPERAWKRPAGRRCSSASASRCRSKT